MCRLLWIFVLGGRLFVVSVFLFLLVSMRCGWKLIVMLVCRLCSELLMIGV